jgi:hypothetical protein
MARIRILPSTLYPSSSTPPSPPATPPPKPSRLFKLAIVGDGSQNRLVHSLIHRTFVDEEGSTLDGMSNASSSFISVASPKNSSELMYRKKDISLWHNGREICVRLQIYSVDCHYDVISDGNPTVGGILDKCQAVLLAIRAPLPSSSRMDHHPSSSSIHSTSTSILGEWPELDTIQSNIEAWLDRLSSRFNNRNCISIVLTHAEDVIPIYSPQHWIELHTRMTIVCKGIVWRIGSCCMEYWNVVPTAAEDGGHVEKNEWMERIQVEQGRLMREAVDEVELALVGLMKVFLDGL